MSDSKKTKIGKEELDRLRDLFSHVKEIEKIEIFSSSEDKITPEDNISLPSQPKLTLKAIFEKFKDNGYEFLEDIIRELNDTIAGVKAELRENSTDWKQAEIAQKELKKKIRELFPTKNFNSKETGSLDKVTFNEKLEFANQIGIFTPDILDKIIEKIRNSKYKDALSNITTAQGIVKTYIKIDELGKDIYDEITNEFLKYGENASKHTKVTGEIEEEMEISKIAKDKEIPVDEDDDNMFTK